MVLSQMNLQAWQCAFWYRKLFTVGQTRVQAIQNRINRAIARASLPRIQDDAKLSAKVSEDAKLSADSSDEINPAKVPAKAAEFSDSFFWKIEEENF